MSEAQREVILKTNHLTKRFHTSKKALFQKTKYFTAVDRVSFEMYRGEMLGLLGESGCGKSTLARMLMHLLEPTDGQIFIKGEPVQGMKEAAFRKKRRQIQMVYQNPFDCLDPSMRVKRLLEEPMKIWFPERDEKNRLEHIREILSECGLSENCLSRFPHEFSGGQLQRLSIARALLIEPEILIADEIISALDVSIQNQILNLLLRLKEMHHLSILFITHDLSVAKKVSDRVMVMQGGQIKETGLPEDVFSKASDPYVRELASAVFTFSGAVPKD